MAKENTKLNTFFFEKLLTQQVKSEKSSMVTNNYRLAVRQCDKEESITD